MLVGVLILHTFALASRIWLTGRPPVVNLYSSAVFIGWACVLAGLGLEALHRLGIGNLVAAVSGGLTLMVAYGLDSGDTMHVLQAVLDTQFWLSTHVVTVTLGYGATFLAGMLGTCAIVHRIWTRFAGHAAGDTADREIQDRLYRMTYGVVCFALFFSFIGTVLGGLWADDSWGRFWGWDPKENGALMIVLWNAAVLHARWDGWIGTTRLRAVRDRRQHRHRLELVRHQPAGHRPSQLRLHQRRAHAADGIRGEPAGPHRRRPAADATAGAGRA